MAKIPRVFQKIFGSNASNNGVFGSARAGTKVISNNLATLMGLAAYLNGWSDATVSGQNLPTLEETQALSYIETTQLAYIFQEGVAEYDVSTEYFQKSIVKKVGTYEIYGSVINNNTGQALTDPTKWTLLQNLSSPGSNIALVSGHILVGSAGGIATDVAMSGDATISNLGVVTLKSSVALAGNPTAATQSPGDNSTRIASTAFVTAAVAAVALPVAASQAQQEAASATNVYTSPGRQQYHPSAAKAWVTWTGITTTTILASYGVSSLTDNGSGDTTINFTTAFSTANYGFTFCQIQSAASNGASGGIKFGTTPAVGSITMVSVNGAGLATDVGFNSATFYGDQ